MRGRRNDAEGLMRMLALACSGSVAAGIKAYEFDIKTKQNEWFDRFFTMPWPSRAGLIA